MQLGAILPQTEIGTDPAAIRRYVAGVEELGLAHIAAFDHVVGAAPSEHPGWSGPYTHRDQFHEPLVLFGFLAAITSLELVTQVLILPQRQTVLAAKQAAEVDVLSGGRLRLGVGVGWNEVEYEALGIDFAVRGSRIDEQVGLMRDLWTKPVISFDGEHDRVTGAGIAPLPVQRPIPIWFGGSSRPALRRIGRIGDGWMVPEGLGAGAEVDDALRIIEDAARAAGRDPGALGVEGRLRYGDGDRTRLAEQAAAWRARGASHLAIHTSQSGCDSVEDHLRGLTAVADAVAA